jgi:hypothetical protein
MFILFYGWRVEDKLANALARGLAARKKMVVDEGGSMSAEEAARQLGISKRAILRRYQKGQLIAWREERLKAVRFPVWQFKEHQVLNGIRETLAVLNAGDRLDDLAACCSSSPLMGFWVESVPWIT